MVRKVRFLTDSEVKRGIAISRAEATELKGELIKARKQRVLHSDATKIEVIKTYIALGGNIPLTAGATGIPFKTLDKWRCTSWWKNLVAEFKKAEKLELSAKTKSIIDRSLDLLHDRLEHGDYYYNPKTAVIERKPVNARDIHTIAKDMIDRKNILDRAFEQTAPQEANGDKLASLAERFAKLAEATLENQKKPAVNVTDVVFVKETDNAPHEERQT